MARKALVLPREREDFDFLAAEPAWRGRKVGVLVEHAHLANYNRQLVNWDVPDAVYREYVLTPRVDHAMDGIMEWRRTLWETFYPRVRRDTSPEEAAQIVATHLHERITIGEGGGWPESISETWERQITSAAGFAALHVAALRSCGIPARLNEARQPEIWTATGWMPAPAPGVLSE
jgi:transglutaminase-like putative cysteine protease